MPTTSTYIDPLNWGTAAGAETTATLGDDRLDTRIPPDSYRVAMLQLKRFKDALIQITQYAKGGNRLKVLANAALQFSVGEYGFQIDTNTAQAIINGVAGKIAAAALTTKGDLIAFTGTLFQRLAVGADGTILTADVASSGGVKWALPSSTASNGTPETVASTGPGAALSVALVQSWVTDGGNATAVSLANGTAAGQEKQITSSGAFTHTVSILVTTKSGFSTMVIPSTTTATAIAAARLTWTGAAWKISAMNPQMTVT